MRISTLKGLAVWRKLLIVCWFGAICCEWAGAAEFARAAHDAGTIQASVSGADPAKTGSGTARIALVIGNGDYRGDPLSNPVNDARTMSDLLRSLGFDVMRYENLSRQRMQAVLLEFNRRLDAGGVGLFYFAGHGLRVGDSTLLVPVDSDSRAPASLLTNSIDLRTVLDNMSRPRPGKLNLVILDTCLNNPFNTAFDSGDRGAADAAEDTLIAYATAPGFFAADGARHGLYTAELLKAMPAPGQDVRQVFRRAAASVRQASDGQQKPWVSSSPSGKLQFNMARQDAQDLPLPASAPHEAIVTMQSRGILPKDSAEQYELTFWDSIKNSSHASDYEAYLKAYPNGRFAALARARIDRLRAAAPKEAPEAARPAPAAKVPPERARPAPATPTPSTSSPERRAPVQQPVEKPSPGVARVSEISDCPKCPALVSLPAGAFTMGSKSSDPSEKPAHQVSINAPFAIGKYEVTVEQWNACVEAGECPSVATDAKRANNTPIRDVSWDDARQYVKWLSKSSGHPYRLPTEAEWEYAARGGTSTPYWWGEQMRKGTANCKECGEPWQQDGPVSVGSFAGNPYGLYDMNGSVWEWVNDCWHSSYKGAPADGRSWEEPNCRMRVIRGGSWREGAAYMMSSTRFKYDAGVRHSQNGFRVARDIK